jgi:hypothetical protein
MNPTIPPAYVAGAVNITAATVQNLLALIQAQLAANCPGTAVELMLTADAANTAAISVGAASTIKGALSASNYGYQLPATGGVTRVYRSTYPGNQAPVGEIQVFSTAAAVLHVELFS